MSKIKGFIGETVIYGFGNVFSRIFAMLLIPLYAKYLGKIDYSNLIMLQSVFTILTFLLALNSGVFYYYYEYDNIKYRKIVLTSWFFYQLIVSIIICILLIFLSPILSNLFIINNENQQIINWCLILVGLQLFPYIFNITNINYFRIERKPKSVITIVILEALFTVILTFLALKIFNWGLIGVLTSQIISRAIVALFYYKISKIYINVKNYSKKILKKIFLYTWPFIISSIFSWVIISIDKFIGAQELSDKTEVALLALAMQLTIPISIISDMIRMAIGPYIMSIRKDADAEKSYQQIYDLCIITASIVVIGIILISPWLTLILADETYLKVIYIIPLIGISKIISLAANQFCISFNLVKKNIYILYSIVLGGITGIVINILFMKDYGYLASGYSQIISYLVMAIFLFIVGRKIANLNLKIKNSIILLAILTTYLVSLIFINPLVETGKYLIFSAISIIFLILILYLYFKQQNLKLTVLIKSIKQKYLTKNNV